MIELKQNRGALHMLDASCSKRIWWPQIQQADKEKVVF